MKRLVHVSPDGPKIVADPNLVVDRAFFRIPYNHRPAAVELVLHPLFRAGIVNRWNPTQRHRHNAAIGELNVHMLIVEMDIADDRLARKRVIRDRILDFETLHIILLIYETFSTIIHQRQEIAKLVIHEVTVTFRK